MEPIIGTATAVRPIGDHGFAAAPVDPGGPGQHCATIPRPKGTPVVAIIGAVLFAIALLFQLINYAGIAFITATTLTTAGLVCVALHLGGVGRGSTRGRGTSRRRD